MNKFRVPINEARRNVTSHFLKVHNINQDEFFANAGFANQSPVKIAELVEYNKWITFNISDIALGLRPQTPVRRRRWRSLA